MKGYVVAFGLLFALAGCDTEQQQADTIEKSTTANVKEVAESVVKQVKPESKETKKSEKQQEKKQAEKPAQPKLDLSISESDLSTANSQQQATADDPQLLPNMFGKKKEGTKVGGGIIRDEENENYMDSIEGAEVKVEIPTN